LIFQDKQPLKNFGIEFKILTSASKQLANSEINIPQSGTSMPHLTTTFPFVTMNDLTSAVVDGTMNDLTSARRSGPERRFRSL
jgi:hypothetical protein